MKPKIYSISRPYICLKLGVITSFLIISFKKKKGFLIITPIITKKKSIILKGRNIVESKSRLTLRFYFVILKLIRCHFFFFF